MLSAEKIQNKFDELSALNWPLGEPRNAEALPDGLGLSCHYDHQISIYFHPDTGAYAVTGPIRARWQELGAEGGLLGYPTSDTLAASDAVGRYNHFQNGSIYWSPQTGAHEVRGAIRARWAALGWERSVLGYPTSDERQTLDKAGFYNDFQKGRIEWKPEYGAHETFAKPITSAFRGGVTARPQMLATANFDLAASANLPAYTATTIATNLQPAPVYTVVEQPVASPALINAVLSPEQPAIVATTGAFTKPVAVADEVVQVTELKPAKFDEPATFYPLKPNFYDKVLLNADLVQVIGTIHKPSNGIPRNQLTVPVSPTENVTDALLFEAPADSNQKYFLPRYRAQKDASNVVQVFFRKTDQGAELRVRLEKYAAPEIELAARDAAELSHQLDVFLRFRVSVEGGSGSGVQMEKHFQLVIPTSGYVDAVLQMSTEAERNAVFAAMTQEASGTTLIVRRLVKVAVPLPPPPPEPDKPILLHPHLPVAEVHKPINPVLNDLPMVNKPIFRGMAKPLDSIGYRVVDLTLDNADERFYYPRELYPNVYLNLPVGEKPVLMRRQVDGHSYYHYVNDRHFYYLPDRIKLARTLPLHTPGLFVQFSGKSMEDLRVALTYFACPDYDMQRIQAAADELKNSYLTGLPEELREPEFEALTGFASHQFKVVLPGTASGILQERPDALVIFEGDGQGISDTIVGLTESQFRGLYDALLSTSGSATLFRGELILDAGDGLQNHIPFEGRLNELLGTLIEWEGTPDNDAQGIRLTVRNVIESPIQVGQQIVGGLYHPQQPADITAAQVQEVTFPFELKPGEEKSFLVSFAGADGLPADTTYDNWMVVVDQQGVTVLPDREAILSAIIDSSIPVLPYTGITVKVLRDTIFSAPPENPVVALVVDFENGLDVDLLRDKLEADATLYQPTVDYLLGKPAPQDYRYKLVTYRNTGDPTESDWLTAPASRSILYVNVG
jgi:hypothetical protein